MSPAQLLAKGKRARRRREKGIGGDRMIQRKFGRQRLEMGTTWE